MKFKHIISMGMVAVVLITTTTTNRSHASQNNKVTVLNPVESQVSAEVKNKSEVVYAKLSANGATTAVYVVNHFEVGKGGSILDYGTYQTVQNLTETKPITQNGDEISFEAQEGNFYYQGNMEAKDLPWTFDITYALDGVEVAPYDLAGKSGELEIQIKTAQNKKVNQAFYENYMLQISLTLDNEKSGEINAPSAILAAAGNNTMLNFTVMPNQNADFKVTMKIKDFNMTGIEIAAMPFSMSMDLPDADSMLQEFDKLPTAISELNEGVGKLADGTSKLSKGATQIKNGSIGFRDGLVLLSDNSTQIRSASTQINDALVLISTSLTSDGNGAGLSDLTKLPTVLTELSSSIQGIAGGMNQLKDGYSLAYAALDFAIQQIPEDAITKELINTQFPNSNETQRQLLDQLYQSYLAGQTVKATYSQAKNAFDQVQPTMENLSVSLRTISGALDEISSKMGASLAGMDMSAQLGQLTTGLTQLSGNYSEFDKGLKEYMDGVAQLAQGYQQFDTGLLEFLGGIGTLDQGVSTLHEGTQKFNEETANMPELIQEEIDKLMKDYTGSEFEDISFVSSKNTDTGLVQFVLKCEDIKMPVKTTAETEIAVDRKQNETVLDRLVALFMKD